VARRPALAALLFASAASVSCSATPIERMGRSAEAIIGGDADVADVGVVALRQLDGTLCSGTLIAPTIVLTAAHCVYGVSPSSLQVLVGDQISSPAQTLAVASVAAYPTYTGEATGIAGGVDLGAVVLAEPLTSVTPVPIDTATSDAELEAATVTLIGFGVSNTADESQVGVRTSVATPVTAVCTRWLTLGGPQANACVGDSGGPVLLHGKIVATVSSGAPDCVEPSTMMRLSAHTDWLANVQAGNPTAPCPTCVQPEPSCDAATETAPAESEDAGPSEEAGAAAKPPAQAASHGGCAAAGAASAAEWSYEVVATLLALGAVWRRRRAGRSRGPRVALL
jgi:secreted trypsin-like serine protease